MNGTGEKHGERGTTNKCHDVVNHLLFGYPTILRQDVVHQWWDFGDACSVEAGVVICVLLLCRGYCRFVVVGHIRSLKKI